MKGRAERVGGWTIVANFLSSSLFFSFLFFSFWLSSSAVTMPWHILVDGGVAYSTLSVHFKEKYPTSSLPSLPSLQLSFFYSFYQTHGLSPSAIPILSCCKLTSDDDVRICSFVKWKLADYKNSFKMFIFNFPIYKREGDSAVVPYF